MTTKRRDPDVLTTLLVDGNTTFPLPAGLDVRPGDRLLVELGGGDTIVAHVEVGLGGLWLRLAQTALPSGRTAQATVRRPRLRAAS